MISMLRSLRMSPMCRPSVYSMRSLYGLGRRPRSRYPLSRHSVSRGNLPASDFAGRLRSGVSIFCRPAIRWLVSRARSVRSLICSSLVTICLRRNSILPFQTVDVANLCRDLPRRVVGCRRFLSRPRVVFSRGDRCRDLSRQVATCRATEFFNLGYVSCDGCRRN